MYEVLKKALRIPESVDIRLEGINTEEIYQNKYYKEINQIKMMYRNVFNQEPLRLINWYYPELGDSTKLERNFVFHKENEYEIFRLMLTASVFGYRVAPYIRVKDFYALADEDKKYYFNGQIIALKVQTKKEIKQAELLLYYMKEKYNVNIILVWG